MLITDVFLWFVLYGVAGWVYESIVISIQDRHLVNRGFLNGPLIPIYGIGAVLVYFSLNGLRGNIPLLFLLGAVLACTVEYLTALLLETLFDTKWWDYSTYKFNLQGRICLIGAVVFGLFTVVLIEWIHPVVKTQIEGVSPWLRLVVAAVFVVAIAIDTVVTVFHILHMNGRLREIQEAFDRFSDYASDRASEMRDSFVSGVRETANGLRETANGLRETTGEMRDSFITGVRNRTSGLRESADGIMKSLLERFEKSEFFSDRIRSLLAISRNQSLRLSRAFPRMHHRRYGSAWLELKAHLQDRKNKDKN